MNRPDFDGDLWTPYGFNWGPIEVSRLAYIEGRGYALGISVNGKRRLQVWVSEKGRSVSVFDGNKKLSEGRDNEPDQQRDKPIPRTPRTD